MFRSFSKFFSLSAADTTRAAQFVHSSKRKRNRTRRHLRLESLERRNLFAGLQFDNLSDLGVSPLAVDTDQAGNAYVTGTFAGTVDFDPSVTHSDGSDTLTARGFKDAYVAKFAPSGELSWVVQMGSDSPHTGGLKVDLGSDIEVDAIGNVYVGGTFVGTGTFGSQTLVAADGGDVFVAKLNSSGNVQWARNWSVSDEDQLIGLDVDNSGNVFAASHDYNTPTTIKKFTAAGSVAWTKTIVTNTRNVSGGDVAVDVAGNVYIADNFYLTVDFDPSKRTKYVSSGSHSLGTSYVLSLNTSGSLRWVSPFAGQGSAVAQSMAIDNSGNILVAGFQTGSVDFQASSATLVLPGKGGFLTNLSATNGYLNWAKPFTSVDGNASLKGLDVDFQGNIYLAGYFYGTVDFDPSAGTAARTSVRGNDMFFLKLSSGGNLQWVETLGSTGDESATAIAVDAALGLHIVGIIYPYGGIPATIDFNLDPSISNEITTDTKLRGFRVRYRQV